MHLRHFITTSLLVIGTSMSMSAHAAPGDIDCSDPAHANMPSCDKKGNPDLPSAAERERRQVQQETIRCNKAKLACKKKPLAQREKCVQQVEENIC
jgi:hypothetical protein